MQNTKWKFTFLSRSRSLFLRHLTRIKMTNLITFYATLSKWYSIGKKKKKKKIERKQETEIAVFDECSWMSKWLTSILYTINFPNRLMKIINLQSGNSTKILLLLLLLINGHGRKWFSKSFKFCFALDECWNIKLALLKSVDLYNNRRRWVYVFSWLWHVTAVWKLTWFKLTNRSLNKQINWYFYTHRLRKKGTYSIHSADTKSLLVKICFVPFFLFYHYTTFR